MEHGSWKHFIPLPEELDWRNNDSFDRYVERIQEYVGFIHREILSQSFYKLSNSPGFRDEFSVINFFETEFVLESWSCEKICCIQPPTFSGTYLDDRITAMKAIGGNIDESSYGHIKGLIAHWKKYGSWQTPIIVINSESFPEHSFAKPYQLFEGHSRLAWAQYFARYGKGLELALQHKVWVLRKKPHQ